MNYQQIILVFIPLVALLAMIAFARKDLTPNLMASVGWHG